MLTLLSPLPPALASAADASQPLVAVLLAVLSGLGLVIAVAMLVHARREERQYLMAPPLWLIPTVGASGKDPGAEVPVQPVLRYEPELEDADNLRRERLGRRTRRLLYAVAGLFMLTVTTSAWVVGILPSRSKGSAFVFVDSIQPTSSGVVPALPVPEQSDTVSEGLAPKERPELVQSQPKAVPHEEASRLPKALDRRERPQRAADFPAPPILRNGAESSASAPLPAPPESAPPVSAPIPVVVPTPAPVRPESTVTAPAPADSHPSPPPPDPALEKARLSATLAGAADRVVRAINGRDLTTLRSLLSASAAGNPGALERFLKLVDQYSPQATLDSLGDAVIARDRGQLTFTISLVWRGDFGVSKRKTGRLLAAARLQDPGWRLQGVTLLDPIP